jgi:molybdopterin-guanine dinucleotide biosynthesis protein A
MSRDLAVVILAGGEGTRIGGGKPLRLLGGKRLIDGALRQARGWSNDVAIAVRDEAQLGEVDAELIVDEPGIGGPLAGLAAGLRFAERSGSPMLLSIPADAPFLPGDLPQRLRASMKGHACALPSSAGQLHPSCGLWRVSAAIDHLPAYLQTGRRSLTGFAQLIGYVAVDWEAGPPDRFFNINSSADLAEAERHAGR